MKCEELDRDQLRSLIVQSLASQGFTFQDRRILPPSDLDKQKLRDLHSLAVQHRIEQAKPGLLRLESNLLQRFAAGSDVVPELIAPRLVEVLPNTEDELLFRYACLHWSIPVSSGYGRRLRFLVLDEQNGKLIGLFGLGDPVFNLRPRDQWIGWDKDSRNNRLQNILDAFALGAVPPYSYLLCGKLVAMIVASREVREAFARKYASRRSLIRERQLDASLALVTTTSALGRSSVYNRVRYRERLLYHSVGFTQGSGDFHFSNGLYAAISSYATRYCKPTAKQENWGQGFRNRREIVRKCLTSLGLSSEWLYHGVRREVFVIPLAKNVQPFLSMRDNEPEWFNDSVADLFSWFRARWLLPRACRDSRYRDFSPSLYRLWSGSEERQ